MSWPNVDRRRSGVGSLALLLILCLVGCDRAQPGKAPAKAPPALQHVTISVAASTKEVIEELAYAFQQTHDVRIDVNPGPSSGLAKQIVAGAPADIFLSASRQWADTIEQAGQTIESQPLLTNALVLVVPASNPGQVKTPADLLSDQVAHVALAGESVPAGMYADQALTKLDLLAPLLAKNRIVRGQDVRSTLSYVDRGEAEAGIVYATDVAIAKNVQQVYAFPADLHDEIIYVLVLLKHSQQNAAAQEFYDFLRSPEAVATFRKHQFQPLEER